MKIEIKQFFGTVPKSDPLLLDPRQSQVAMNCKLWSGKIKPWNSATEQFTLQSANPVLSIYKHADAYWFESEEDTNYAPGPIVNDAGYVYFSQASGRPRITSTSKSVIGMGAYPRGDYYLGVPTPTTAPGVTIESVTGNIVNIDTGFVSNDTGDSITVNVAEKAVVKYTVRVSIQTEQFWTGAFRGVISVGGEEIAAEEVTVVVRGRPGEPDMKGATIEIETTYAPDAPGEVTFLFGYGPVTPASNPLVANYSLSSQKASVRQSGAVVVEIGADHGLVEGNTITIDGAGGMGSDFNGKKYTIVKMVDTNKLLIASSTSRTYTGGGSWTKQFPLSDTESRAYVFTYISDFEGLVMEGAPSPASEIIEIGDDLDAVVSFPADVPAAEWNVTGVRLYRTVTAEDGSAEFQFVTELDGAQPTPFSDGNEADDLGEVLSTDDYIPPPAGLLGLVGLDNGVMAGFDGNELLLCEPYQPHAFPSEYIKLSAYTIVALVPIGGSTLAILTEGTPYILTGRHPVDASFERIDMNYACLSKRAAVDMGYAAVYPSDEGLIELGVGRASILTANLFSRDEWQEYNPPSMIAARHGNRYVCFYEKLDSTTGGFVLDPTDPRNSLTFLNYHATAVWTDPYTGQLNMVIGDTVQTFDDNLAERETYTWRSKRFEMPADICMSVGQVLASAYPVTLRLYAMDDEGDMTLRHTETVTDRDIFRLTGDYLSDHFELEVTGDATVKSIAVAESVDDLRTT